VLKGNVRLFRIKGIPVTINWTWLFVFVLVVAGSQPVPCDLPEVVELSALGSSGEFD
jgi:hypothetical protein